MKTEGFKEAYQEHLDGEKIPTITIEYDEDGLIEWDKIRREDKETSRNVRAILSTLREIRINCSHGERMKDGKITGKILIPEAKSEQIPFSIDTIAENISIGKITAETRAEIEELITKASNQEEENPTFTVMWSGKTQSDEDIIVEEICGAYFLEHRINKSNKDWRVTIAGEEIEIIKGEKRPEEGIEIEGRRKSDKSKSKIKIKISFHRISTLNDEKLISC